MSLRITIVLSLSLGLQSACAARGDSDGVMDVDARSELLDITQEVEGATPIAHAARWEPLDLSEDPIASSSLGVETQCGEESLTVELTDDGLYLDLDTTACDWLTVTQSSTAPLQKGDMLRIWAFRWPMVVAEGEGLISLSAGEPPLTLWEARPLLPQERSELYYEDVPVMSAVPSGTPLYWHVSNHGQNVWSLLGVLRVDSSF